MLQYIIHAKNAFINEFLCCPAADTKKEKSGELMRKRLFLYGVYVRIKLVKHFLQLGVSAKKLENWRTVKADIVVYWMGQVDEIGRTG